MLTVGLTGGIATGKSTAADALRALGAPVLDADRIAREVSAPGSEGLAAIRRHFGPGVIRADGSLDRGALGAIVMADSAARARLEAITHPLIIAAISSRLRALADAGRPAAVVEAALMVETGSWRGYGELWVVTCSPETQRARLMARNHFSREQAERWIASQLPLADKEAVATRVFRNEGGVEDLHRAIGAAWRELLDRAQGPPS